MKKLIRASSLALVLLLCLSVLSGCDTPVEGLTVSSTSVTVPLAQSVTVTCTVTPADATNNAVSWRSSDTAIATVDNFGVISGVSVGRCTVYAQAEAIVAPIEVVVVKPVEKIELSETELEVREEKTATVSVTITPTDATNTTAAWTSSDAEVATVDQAGTITGVKEGSCVITCTVDGQTATVNVTVKSGIDFEALYNSLDDKYGWTLGSDGSYLSVDDNVLNLDDYYNSTIDAEIQDMIKTMGLPDSLYNDMLQTTWSMGKQVEKFEDLGIEVSWTYHPDKGLEITFKQLHN